MSALLVLQCIAADEALLLLLALAAGGVLQYVLAINSFKEKLSYGRLS